jgi:hypothetical protein
VGAGTPCPRLPGRCHSPVALKLASAWNCRTVDRLGLAASQGGKAGDGVRFHLFCVLAT